jgi:translation initiation factor 1A
MPKTNAKKKHNSSSEPKELMLRETGLEYAQVGKMLGNGRLEAICFDGKTRLGHIRGKLLKKVWISTGDVILVALRDFQDDKTDVVFKYTPEQIKKLKNMGELPSNVKTANDINFKDFKEEEEDIDISFEHI